MKDLPRSIDELNCRAICIRGEFGSDCSKKMAAGQLHELARASFRHISQHSIPERTIHQRPLTGANSTVLAGKTVFNSHSVDWHRRPVATAPSLFRLFNMVAADLRRISILDKKTTYQYSLKDHNETVQISYNRRTIETDMNWLEWYNTLSKPEWTPAPATISLIWQILYPIILISFGYVFVQAGRGRLPRKIVIPFVVNLIANLSFTPLLFGLRNLPLATLDILIVWSTILWMCLAVWRHSRWVAMAQVPYFIWVSIASVLQISIFWSNWKV